MIGHGYHKWILILLVLTGVLLRSCYKEEVIEEPEEWNLPERVVAFDQVYAFTDMEEHMLLYTLPSDTIISFTPHVRFGNYYSISINGIELRDGEENDLEEVVVNHPYTVVAQNSEGRNTFQLYFTNLPMVHIYTETEIPDEPKVISRAEIQYVIDYIGEPQTLLFQTFAGIEIRGRTSAQHEKKSYGLELWENRNGSDHSAPLLGMRYGEDWILDAMYIDPLRMRNKLSFEIWEKMWSGKSETPWRTVNPGIRSEYVELFINQRYMGLYSLSERLDETLINLSAGRPGAESVIYKAISWEGGSTAFQTYNSEPEESMIWEGWEQVYPDHLFCWEPLAELRKMVVLDENELFTEKIDSLIDLECAADYYLFINLLLAHDNIIKNYYLARYPDESRFLILPWDMEGSLGIMWNGRDYKTEGILENNLYNRLRELDVKGFNDLLENRWNSYRESIFLLDSLLAPARRYTGLLKRSGAIERENGRWQGVEIDIDYELLYLSQWTTLRLAYLDQVFD